MRNILIEIIASNEKEIQNYILELSSTKLVEIDLSYKPVPIVRRKKNSDFSEQTFIVKGKTEEVNLKKIELLSFIYKIWNDTRIEPTLCKCNSSKKGDLDEVAECIGAKQLWNKGFRGDGIIIGIVDVGVDKSLFPVIGGSFPNWGIINNPMNDPSLLHGNMTTTDAIGVAPNAKIYDLNYNVSAGGTISGVISQALLAFDWAINQHKKDGTPHILSNSWGIYQEAWDINYATNPNHPFTLKVEEALDAGIKVVFSAGNCGETCPDKRCNTDTGTGKDIWGANGHEEVMTVGAVKLNNHRLKYSSQGPAALFVKKPNFCTYSSFKGYYWGVNSSPDSGTSAACPIVAGCVALLLCYNNSLTQLQIKNSLENTAKDIEGYGFDYNTGYGVVRIDNAYYEFEPSQKPTKDFRDNLCDYVYNIERKCTKWEETQYEECTKKSDNGHNSCTNWGKNCCTWKPCSWACKLFEWICHAWVWIENIVCVAWTWIITRVCKFYAWILTSITITNCKCR